MQVMIPALLAIALAGASHLAAADPGNDGLPPGLTLPDEPAIPMAPDTDVFGPSGPSGDLFPPLPAGPGAKDTPPPAAETVEPAQTPEQRRQSRIDDLLKRLAAAQDETEATTLAAMLDRLWLQSGSDTADLLMARAVAAVGADDRKLAEQLLDKIIALEPGWAEAWNKRATVRYLDDDDAGAMEDISHALALEPHHFGALSGMGFILHRNGDDKGALRVFRRAAAINPQNKDIKGLIERLTPAVEGHDL